MKKLNQIEVENKLKTPIEEYKTERDIISFYNKIIDIDEELIPIGLFLLTIEEFNNIIDKKTEDIDNIPDVLGKLLEENKDIINNLGTFLNFNVPILNKEE